MDRKTFASREKNGSGWKATEKRMNGLVEEVKSIDL